MTPPPTILTPQTRAALFDPPSEREDIHRRYVLTPEDIALVRRHRRAHNRLGFAVQLALVHDLGRSLRTDEMLANARIDVVADQLGIEPAVFDLYARRDETRRDLLGRLLRLAEYWARFKFLGRELPVMVGVQGIEALFVRREKLFFGHQTIGILVESAEHLGCHAALLLCP